MEIYQVFEETFDSLENQESDAINTKILASFISTENETAHFAASKFISGLPPATLYLGWNKQIYPKIYVKVVYSNN